MATDELIYLAQHSQVKLPRKDLTGQPFGRLVVTQYLGTHKSHGKGRGLWRCDCECGNTKIVTTEALNILGLCHTRRGAGKHVNGIACNTAKRDKDPVLWLTEKLGPHRAKIKYKEIETYFALTKERTSLCLIPSAS